MDKKNMRFGEYAIQNGWVKESDLIQALSVQATSGERMGTLLVRMGLLSRRQRLEILSLISGLPYLDRLPSSFAVLSSLFGQRVKVYSACPVRHRGRRGIRKGRREQTTPILKRMGFELRQSLAIPDPCDEETLRNLRVWRPKARIIFYDFPPQSSAVAEDVPFEQSAGGVASPAVEWLDEALDEGIRMGASDLHLVRESSVMMLRYRVHGRFRPGPQVPAAFQEALIPRVKVMAGLDIAEERLPQDGSFERRLSGRRFDFRVSVLPGVEGEGLVIRVLGGGGRNETSTGLDDLEMPERLLSELRAWAQRRAGLVLITGPTGSGKTTTLYALLRELDRTQLKVVTLEDPVEYALDGAHQVQVNPEIGFTFAHGLRAILRHDPDVILVGEIRDKETAEIALRASLTGHLVLSTLHTNSAVGAFTRLHDMGIPPYLTADAVLGVLAQRLVGRTCRGCSGLDSDCLACHGSGIDGRMAVFEGGPAQPLRDLIRSNAPEDHMREVLHGLGYPTLVEDARTKYRNGVVPREELMAAGLWGDT